MTVGIGLKARGPRYPQATHGRSHWDIVLPAPTAREILVCEGLWDSGVLEGEAYFGAVRIVLLLKWKKAGPRP